ATGSVNNGTLVNGPDVVGSGAQFVPDVLASAAINLASSNSMATFTGFVNPGNLATVAYFDWVTNGDTGDFPNHSSTTNLSAANSAVSGIKSVSALPTDTYNYLYYFFRVVAYNSAGTNIGPWTEFDLPVQTSPATDITFQSATLNGFVYSNSLPATVYFQWG